jgi:PEGA domain
MRFAIAFLATPACLAAVACSVGVSRVHATSPPESDLQGVLAGARPNVAAARDLDQEGVRSFREGRYSDAIEYFRAAYRLGGPSSELWNIVRSRERLDDPEGACSAIDEYLAQQDLSPQDRAEADREQRTLRTRPSVLTLTTTPAGATVTVDGKETAGPTPVSIEVSPGQHTIAVMHEGYAGETRRLDARFGHAVIVSLDLVGTRK